MKSENFPIILLSCRCYCILGRDLTHVKLFSWNYVLCLVIWLFNIVQISLSESSCLSKYLEYITGVISYFEFLKNLPKEKVHNTIRRGSIYHGVQFTIQGGGGCSVFNEGVSIYHAVHHVFLYSIPREITSID